MRHLKHYCDMLLCVYLHDVLLSVNFVLSQNVCTFKDFSYSRRNNYLLSNVAAANSQVKNLFIERHFEDKANSNDTFSRFKQLGILSISCFSENSTCKALSVDDGLLDPIKDTLQYLGLSNNSINSFPDNYFCSFLKLQELEISHNDISDIATIGFGDQCRMKTSGTSMTCLAIDHNKIEKVPKNVFLKLKNLKHLYLAENGIQEIESGAFNGLDNVNLIDLQSNHLRTLPDTLFKKQSKLWKLRLQFNQLTSLPSFQRLTNLKYLLVYNNNLTSLPNLTSLNNLHCLKLQNNKISNISLFSDHLPKNLALLNLSGNKITKIEKETFAGNLKLIKLYLSRNNIAYIEPGSFDKNVKLQEIHVNNNHLKTVFGLIESIPIKVLDASYNNIRNFSHVSPEITFSLLNLSHNQLEFFHFNNQPKLNNSKKIIIDMSFNRLTNTTTLPIPNIVHEIWLNDNEITSVDMHDLKPSRSLQAIYLHNNAIRTFCEYNEVKQVNMKPPPAILVTLSGNPLICSCDTEWIKTNANKVLVINDGKKVQCTSHYPRGNKVNDLVNWDYFLCESGCDCPGTLPWIFNSHIIPLKCDHECLKGCNCFRNRGSTFQYVDCSRRNLTRVPNQSLQANRTHLFLDGNMMSYLEHSDFSNVSILEALYLNSSHLEDFHPKTFDNLTVLQILNLENNLLKFIPENAFSKLINLRELYLSHNKLVQLDSFANTRMLVTLELHNNYLTNYPVWKLENATKLQSVTLQENPWSCECDYIRLFQGWLMRSRNLGSKENLSCIDKFNQRRLIYNEFEECNSQTAMIVIIASVSTVVVILSILVFAYRRKAQILLYSRYGVRVFRTDNSDLDKDKEFDVFVSYSSKDSDFLVANILPNLEAIDPPYRVCLHDRDFLAGSYISENIVSAIDKCRRTIILLSDNFVKSEWCRYEFRTAHTKMLEDKCNRVVVIVKDKIPENVDSVLRAYLRTNTYLIWGERLFWKKLYFALPNPLKTNEITNNNIN